MLAGCSSTLVSPRHRLRSEASTQFQACHIPAMSTQRLDLPRGFGRKEGSRPQPVRPVGIAVEKKPIESKSSGCSLRQNIKLPPVAAESRRESRDEFWERSKSLKKRYAAEVSYDEGTNYMSRVKRKRGNGEEVGQQNLRSSEDFWFHPGFNAPQVPLPLPLPFSLSCSGEREEERVCFVPGEAIAPPLPPLSSIPWFDSVVTEITKDVQTVKGCPDQKEAASGSSSTSSGSHGLALGLSGSNPTEVELGNGSSSRNPSVRGEVAGAGHNVDSNSQREHEYVELITLVVACAEQISSKNIAGISHCLARLGELASPRGSPVHRLIAYFTEALALRVARLWPHIFHITAPRELDRGGGVGGDDDGATALRLLNQVSPIPKFIHFTCNEILLRAFEGKDRVHIIDFDIKQGLQWPSLFQSLATRTHPPSHVRITGIGESKQELVETGDRLSGFAEAFNLPFEFHPVVDRLEDVRLWMLHVKEKESVAVNCVFQLHKMLYDGSGGTLRDFLRLIRSTNAEVVVMAEQEAAHNEVTMDARLFSSLKYYSAIFDSVDSSLPLESPARVKIEEMFGREIRNIIACEGRERSERHETFEKWLQMMEGGGFRCTGISERELLQGQMMLKMYSSNENYRVNLQQNGGGGGAASSLTLSWLDQPLYSVSAWAPVDVAGGSLPCS
ncbi:GRAS family transcription factor [Perilla frutescens var. hirtella]|uniref:GRAS family transcription factor n=1 Tax=Perilla frutescens var. hirtella TaxID=608512 RepID=A0AAD4P9M2_PERFH|nr:GRAS family transcription factor [Perilla frutescens var. hirtella]